MSETLVTLGMQAEGLLAIVSVVEIDDSGLRCAVVRKRIADTKAPVCSSVRRATEAWQRLSRRGVRGPGGTASALTLLLDAVPLASEVSGRWPPVLGTWPEIRSALKQDKERVFAHLHGEGYEVAGLELLLEARDPYAAYHHRAPDAPGLATLPVPFRASLLPLLRARSWREVRRSLALYWALGLDHEHELLALLVRLLTVAPEHGLAWCGHLAAQMPERRARFVRVLLDSDAQGTDPSALPEDVLPALNGLEDSRFQDRLTHLLVALRSGIPAAHILEGFAIADGFAPDHEFVRRRRRVPHRVDPPRPGGGGDLRGRLEPVLRYIVGALGDDPGRSFPVVLWDHGRRRPELREILSRPALLAWPGRTTVHFLRGLVYEEDDGHPLTERAAAAERLLAAVPASHHVKALDGLEAMFRRWRRPETLRERLPIGSALLARMSRPPFGEAASCGEGIAVLVDAAWRHGPARLLAASERSLVRLERALVSDEAAGWLQGGLESLGRRMDRFMADAFLAHPEPLLATARLLGGLALPRRIAAVKRFRCHRVLQGSFLSRPLGEICSIIEADAGPGMPNPIPRKLRDHLSGTAALTPGSVERHRQAIRRKLLAFKLGLLRSMILEDLGRGLASRDLTDGRERHALQMLGSVGTHRRLLRRMLALAPEARSIFLVAHPANRAWLRRHPGVDGTAWARGVTHVVRPGNGDPLRLALATDPLEVLQMGTEVGSCLSLGGIWEDSAIANMADVNKQVVFARRLNGTFVARQLVAISEDDRLVFFPVYPRSTAQSVQRSFYEYDLSLAAAMGLAPVRGTPDAEYTIAPILARIFYDDGLWERFVVAEEA